MLGCGSVFASKSLGDDARARALGLGKIEQSLFLNAPGVDTVCKDAKSYANTVSPSLRGSADYLNSDGYQSTSYDHSAFATIQLETLSQDRRGRSPA